MRKKRIILQYFVERRSTLSFDHLDGRWCRWNLTQDPRASPNLTLK
jgi:hypothetical protein